MNTRCEQYPAPALTAVAESAGMRPSAVTYLSTRHQRIIVAPRMSPTTGNYTGPGVYLETEPTTTLDWHVTSDVLGLRIWEALLMFRRAPLPPERPEWGAFKASGLKSMRAFESEFVRVTIDAFPTVLTIQAEVPAKMANGLFVGRSISSACEFDDLGDLVRLVHRCALYVLEAEFS